MVQHGAIACQPDTLDKCTYCGDNYRMTGDELRQRRLALKLTQNGLGERLSLTARTVRAWERGEYAIPGWATLAVGYLELERRARLMMRKSEEGKK